MSDEVKTPEVTELEVQVSQDAYKKVSADMHRFKTEAKTLASKIAEIQAETEAKEKAVMEEKEEWSQLYKKSEAKLKGIETERQAEKAKFVESHKINAVIQSLGGFIKPDYNRFIDTANIQVQEDGSIDDSSVVAEVERIRKIYPELVKQRAANKLPSDAPKSFGTKSLNQMTQAERDEARSAIFKKQ